MGETYHVLLQVFYFGLLDLSKVNAGFSFSFACYKVSTKQLGQLNEGGNAHIRKIAEPLLSINVAGKQQ